MNGFELKDEASWSVYADWLEERGDPAAAIIRAALDEPDPQDQWGLSIRIDAGDVGGAGTADGVKVGGLNAGVAAGVAIGDKPVVGGLAASVVGINPPGGIGTVGRGVGAGGAGEW